MIPTSVTSQKVEDEAPQNANLCTGELIGSHSLGRGGASTDRDNWTRLLKPWPVDVWYGDEPRPAEQ